MKKADDVREARKTNGETGAGDGKNEMLKKAGIIGVVALVAFLLGFVPMWLSARTHENERDAAINTLRPSVLQNTLGTAALNARRGEFEQARQQTRIFSRNCALKWNAKRVRLTLNSEQPRSRSWHSATKRSRSWRETTVAAVDRLTDLYFAFMQMKSSPAPEKQ